MSVDNQLTVLQSRLVHLIIDEEFGEESGLICEAISKRQQLSLPQISDLLKETMSDKSIKYIMILLIKNGVLSYKQGNNTIEYTVNIQAVLSILRYPTYLKHVKSLYGVDAETIIEYFLNNSQGTFDECLAQYIQEYPNKLQGKEATTIKKKLKDCFILLIKKNYLQRFNDQEGSEVEQVQPAELKTDKEDELAAQNINSKRKRGDQGTLEKPKQKRAKNNKLLIEDDDELAEFVGSHKTETAQTTSSNAEDYLLFNSSDKSPQNFKINVRQFIHELRCDEICRLAEGKLNTQAKQVVRALLESSQRIGRAVDVKTSEYLPIDQVKALVSKSIGKDALFAKEDDLQKFLRMMKRDGGKFIAIDFINGKEAYAVNLEKILNKMKSRHIAKIVERRYDMIAGRIFRILKKYKFLEEKAISEISLQSIKDTQKYLNKLSADGFIEYKEIKEKDKTVNLVSLFKFDNSRVNSKIVSQYYQALFNLKTRLSATYEREKQLEIEKKIRPDDAQLKEQWQETIKMIMKLEMAIIELDQALLVFTEF